MYGTLTRKFSLPQLTSRDCGNWYQPLCGFYGTVLLRMRWWHRQAEKCLWSGGGYQENSCARRDVGADIARCCWPVWPAGNGACSSAGEHYVDIVGVTGSIPVTPTISSSGKLHKNIILMRFVASGLCILISSNIVEMPMCCRHSVDTT